MNPRSPNLSPPQKDFAQAQLLSSAKIPRDQKAPRPLEVHAGRNGSRQALSTKPRATLSPPTPRFFSTPQAAAALRKPPFISTKICWLLARVLRTEFLASSPRIAPIQSRNYFSPTDWATECI